MTAGQRGQFFNRECKADINLPTIILKMTCCEKGIATVVTLATKDNRKSRFREKLPDARRDPLPCDLHKTLRGGSFGKGIILRIFHLDGRQDHDL